MTYGDIYKLEVLYRKWFIDRLIKDAEREKELNNKNSGIVELKPPNESNVKKFF